VINISLPSGLYSFRLDDLQELRFNKYTLTNVFEKITLPQRKACIELWLRNRVINDKEEALARSDQVCYFITETQTGKLIGVNTLYKSANHSTGNGVWLNRMFIDPKHRNTRVMIVGTAMMLCFSKTYLADRGLKGVVNINENTKLRRAGTARLFKRLGYRVVGEENGKEVMFFEFNNVNFVTDPLTPDIS
jgi:hypothetical protein